MSAHTTHRQDDDGVRVRLATINDASEIARLLTQLGYPATPDDIRARWISWEAQGNSAVVVDSGNKTLYGVGTLHLTQLLHRPTPVGRVTSLVVDETQRGRGFGKRIMERAEHELQHAGCGLIEITSNMKRSDAHAFYESIGYEKTSVRLFKSLGGA